MEKLVPQVALYLALTIESVALLVITTGLVIALIRALLHRMRQGGWFGTFDDVRKSVGRTLLLGLELLLAAEIVRSIMAGETLTAALTLGVVVVVRTFLSITIEMEINGRWPWNSAHPPLNEPEKRAR